MGDGHHGAAKTLEELLQPFDRFGVQVVGRFVEQQHVRLGQQQAAQRHAALFTTGQRANLGLPGRQAQRIGGDVQQVVGVLATGSGDDGFEFGLFGGQSVKVRVGFAVGGVDLVQALLGGQRATDAFFHRFTHALLGVELWFLRQVSDLETGHRDGFAFDVLVEAGHDFQQRGLARAVQAQHADLGAGEEGQRDVLQDLSLRRHGLADAVHGEDVLRHVCSPLSFA